MKTLEQLIEQGLAKKIASNFTVSESSRRISGRFETEDYLERYVGGYSDIPGWIKAIQKLSAIWVVNYWLYTLPTNQ